MALRWLDTVRFDKLHSAMVLAANRVDQVYSSYGTTECWITSANDSQHNTGSLHPEGKAMDFRTKDIALATVQAITHAVTLALGSQFYVRLEQIGSTPETSGQHLHVQFNGN